MIALFQRARSVLAMQVSDVLTTLQLTGSVSATVIALAAPPVLRALCGPKT